MNTSNNTAINKLKAEKQLAAPSKTEMLSQLAPSSLETGRPAAI